MQRNIKPGVFENVVGLSIGTFTQNLPTHFKLDTSYPFLVSNVVIKQGAVVVPPSSYTLSLDTKATLQEVGKTDAQLYGMITITNVVYTGVELNFTGQNFGSYSSNDSNADYVDKSITTLSNTLAPLIDAIFLNGIPLFDPATEYLKDVSFVQDEGVIWLSNFGTIGVPNVGNTPSTNQDKWYFVSAPTRKQPVLNGESISVGWHHIELTIGNGIGDPVIPNPDPPLFDGQVMEVTTIGSSVSETVGGNGIYVNSVFGTAGLLTRYTGKDGLWQADSGITADYVDGKLADIVKNHDLSRYIL